MTEAESSSLLKGSTERTVFISYSWTPEQHRQWVLELAKRLVSHGIDVILDVWHLKPGQDKYVFMERMVTDPQVKRVLIICNRSYQEKADGRTGGVGTESQIISPEVYGKVDQEKFIPIVVEHDNDGVACVPKYLTSRLHIDMSKTEDFEVKYQELLRNLYGRAESSRPPLGTPPAYITGGDATPPRAASVVTAAPAAGITTHELTDHITTFFGAFIRDLEEFRFKRVPDEPFDETIAKLIEK